MERDGREMSGMRLVEKAGYILMEYKGQGY